MAGLTSSPWRQRRKTKIVVTLGPASSDPLLIAALIEAGMNIARLNFSHGSHEEHSRVLNAVREQSARLGRHVAVFQDLCGPKLRIGPIDGSSIVLQQGRHLRLCHGKGSGSNGVLFIDVFDPAATLRPGHKILLADGLIELIAEEIGDDGAICRIITGGEVRSRTGIVTPDSDLMLPCITEKDRNDLKWAAANDIDYVALSFVGSAGDIVELRSLLQSLGKELPIIAKFERARSLDDVAGIAATADAVMVARGDLGLELPLERVPSAQRLIIDIANRLGTPVITATQMLSSMVREVRPTRAEVSDVYTAVRDGTDCVMLSEETAIGKFPVEAVQILASIIEAAEQEESLNSRTPLSRSSESESVADAVCFAARSAADKIGAAAILARTHSGYTARLMAKYRPEQALFGATSELSALRRMVLYWGVEPVLVHPSRGRTPEDEVLQAVITVRDKYGLKPGSRLVVTAGLTPNIAGATSILQIRDVPRPR